MYARELCKPLPSKSPGGPDAGRPRAEPLTFNSADEEAMVDDVFANAISSLSEVPPLPRSLLAHAVTLAPPHRVQADAGVLPTSEWDAHMRFGRPSMLCATLLYHVRTGMEAWHA